MSGSRGAVGTGSNLCPAAGTAPRGTGPESSGGWVWPSACPWGPGAKCLFRDLGRREVAGPRVPQPVPRPSTRSRAMPGSDATVAPNPSPRGVWPGPPPPPRWAFLWAFARAPYHCLDRPFPVCRESPLSLSVTGSRVCAPPHRPTWPSAVF